MLADQELRRHSLHLRYKKLLRVSLAAKHADKSVKGVSGLSARDIKLFVDGGYHTVESVAYTFVINTPNR